MFILIGIWGSRDRKLFASNQFLLYTLFGSLFILNVIIFFLLNYGSVDVDILNTIILSPYNETILWSLLFFGFCIKIPMMPFHLWLPEAHVEAPTAGSVLLAGVLLKLGSYGFIRFLIYLWPFICLYYLLIIYILATFSVFFSSLITLRQIDIKKIIAYSSIVHMNFSLLGLFSFSISGLIGGLIATLSHGFISSGLFLSIGVLYERYHSRLLKYYGGLAQFMPLFAIMFFFLTLGNISFPCTLNFVGEFLIILGILYKNLIITIINIISLIFSTIYAFWLMNRIIFGQICKYIYIFKCKLTFLHFNNLKFNRFWTFHIIDIKKREIFILTPLIQITFFSGLITDFPINILFFQLYTKYTLNFF